ncbi:MAG TPA: hypothetical protein VG053_06840 [Solirubrobacteraceae bacterium]|jgi:hypothetical protein|nr:hypothetical protein [Solirubrobacteraceae bacterium]
MQSQSKQVPARVERIIALFVLDHPAGCSRAELDGELHDIDTEAVSAALSGLEDEGVVIAEGEKVRASKCIRHLDALNLISA